MAELVEAQIDQGEERQLGLPHEGDPGEQEADGDADQVPPPSPGRPAQADEIGRTVEHVSAR